MYRYFKGEAANPFNQDRENTQFNFWFYESVFDELFTKKESSDWYSFFSDYGMGTEFMNILTENDYERPAENAKNDVFDLWLTYLFEYKLYPEYGGENFYKKLYYSIAP